MLSNPPATPLPTDSQDGRGPFLGLSLLIPWLVGAACLFAPLIYWFGAYDPRGWEDEVMSWHDDFITTVVILLCAGLFLLPLIWVIRRRVIDLIALALGQQALIFAGYFYLDQTAARFPDNAQGILAISGLVVLFNAVGFLCLFLALSGIYALTKYRHYQLRPLEFPAELLDQRLLTLARVLSLFCIIFIATPMVASHTIPLFSDNNAVSRMELSSDGALRPLLQAGGALLPFVAAILAVSIVRRPTRFFGGDTILFLLLTGTQLLTSNRLALAIAAGTILCGVTMHLRFPRLVLALVFTAYLSFFTLASGFTSLLRLDPGSLQNGDWVGKSVQEAYLGDNIIDLRDGSWVFSKWDFEPLMGMTYLGGVTSMVPSAILPEKKQWHLGLTGVRIVGMPDEEHFGLRITFFGEAFLNFGWAGVIALGTLLGAVYAVILRQVHLATEPGTPSCLYRNISLLILLQCLPPLSNTSDASLFWAMLAMLLLMHLTVVAPLRRRLSSVSLDSHAHEPAPSRV